MAGIPVSLFYRLLSFQWDYCVELTDEYAQTIKKGSSRKLYFSQIAQKPEVKSGLLWDKIVFQPNGQEPFTISGVQKKESEESLTRFTHLIGQYQVKQFRPAYAQISSSHENFKSLFGNKYIRHSAVESNLLTERQRLVCVVNEDNNLLLAGAGLYGLVKTAKSKQTQTLYISMLSV